MGDWKLALRKYGFVLIAMMVVLVGSFAYVTWDEFFNELTSIEAITSAKRPADVTDKRVDLKLVQIPEYDQVPGDRPVVYDSTNNEYIFLVHDGLGNKILVTASAEPKRLVFEPLPVRVPHIDFEPKPGDYVSIKGTVGFAMVDLWFDNTLNLYIAAYEVKRVPIHERPLWD